MKFRYKQHNLVKITTDIQQKFHYPPGTQLEFHSLYKKLTIQSLLASSRTRQPPAFSKRLHKIGKELSVAIVLSQTIYEKINSRLHIYPHDIKPVTLCWAPSSNNLLMFSFEQFWEKPSNRHKKMDILRVICLDIKSRPIFCKSPFLLKHHPKMACYLPSRIQKSHLIIL